MTRQKIKSREEQSSRSARCRECLLRRSSTGLRGCCRRTCCRTRWSGWPPEETPGPGGLMTQLAGRARRDGAGRRADRAPGLSARAGAAGRSGQRAQRLNSEAGAHRARDGRDQDATGPQGQLRAPAVRKRQTRLAGLDDRVLGPLCRRHERPGYRPAPHRALRHRDRPRHDLTGHRRGAGGHRRLAHPAAGRRSTRSSTSTA